MFKLVLIFFSFQVFSQAQDSLKTKDLAEVVVSATRASEKSGMAFSNISSKEIQKRNLGQDMPFLLNQQPSVTISSDAGTGVGYTGIRIRGTDPTRINVSVNGIPYNDAESQGVYWVNMPDLSSSVQSIQIQRGVGTSTNGAGSFGGSININTMKFSAEPTASVSLSGGSFGTLKTTAQFSSGLLKKYWILDGRLSRIVSDGFVDRSAANLRSYYVSAGHYKNENFYRLNIFSGKEKTYQSWNGIPEALANNDVKGIEDFIERNFYDAEFKKGLLERGRRFNFYNYENEIDNYSQTHYQFISSIKLGKNLRFNPAIHYTPGSGYFEQYKYDQTLENYSDSYNSSKEKSNLIRQKWLDNHFYGLVWSLDKVFTNKLSVSWGGAINQYLGGHFGKVVWVENAPKLDLKNRYYENNSVKNDRNFYTKNTYNFNSKWSAYTDLQIRNVDFVSKGTLEGKKEINEKENYTFFNPKIGLSFKADPASTFYVSYAKGSKEPSRQDFVDNLATPKAEKLHDFEGGYKKISSKSYFEANLYAMNYQNQLVLTGQVNEVGEAIRTNVAYSYRRGVELVLNQNLNPKINLGVNLNLSQNKIKSLREFVASYGDLPNIDTELKNKDVAFSPKIIAGGTLNFKPFENLELSLLPKYIGKQYVDNTQSETRKLDAYFVSDFSLNFSPKKYKKVGFKVLVNNLLNAKYESNAYTYSYLTDKRIDEVFVFPQAGINFLAGLNLSF